MIVVGFDVAKVKLDGVVYEDGRPRGPVWQIPNTLAAIKTKLSQLQQEHPGGFGVACESTGNYHLELITTCWEFGIQAQILNPIITKQQTKSTIRKTKTDVIDAGIIARLGSEYKGALYRPQPYGAARQHVRVAVRLTKQTTVLKQLIHSLGLVPVQDRQSRLQTTLQALLDRHEQTVASLYSIATAAIDAEILQLLRSIPGMGERTATAFLVEIGSIARFQSPRAIVAYAGLDPAIKQSGHGPVHYGKLTQRGSAVLRRALFLAANSARQHDPQLKQAYETKRAEGKSHATATIHVARKLIYRIYAVLTQKRSYEIRSVEEKS